MKEILLLGLFITLNIPNSNYYITYDQYFNQSIVSNETQFIWFEAGPYFSLKPIKINLHSNIELKLYKILDNTNGFWSNLQKQLLVSYQNNVEYPPLSFYGYAKYALHIGRPNFTIGPIGSFQFHFMRKRDFNISRINQSTNPYYDRFHESTPSHMYSTRSTSTDKTVITTEKAEDNKEVDQVGLINGFVKIKLENSTRWYFLQNGSLTYADGHVICKMMGYATINSIGHQVSTNLEKLIFHNFNCSFQHHNINQCIKINYDKMYYKRYYFSPQYMTTIKCYHEFKLSYDTSSLLVRFRVKENSWGYVGYHTSSSGLPQLLCKHFGYDYLASYNSLYSYNSKLTLTNVNCEGKSKLRNCSYEITASHSQLLRLSCANKLTIIRIINGTHNSGRLETNGRSVCYDKFTKSNADIICKELGYVNAIKIWPTESNEAEQIMTCPLGASLFSECSFKFSSNCSTNAAVNIFCQNVKLINGLTNAEGRIELIYKYQQGSLCGSSFSFTAAHTICKQLGFRKALVHLNNSTKRYGIGNKRYILRDLICVPGSSDINTCQHSGWNNYTCNDNAAGVICDTLSDPCPYKRNTPNVNNTKATMVKIIPDNGNAWCTGIFIDYQWIITTASCFVLPKSQYQIITSDSKIKNENFNIFIHPSYSDKTGDNNGALIKIHENFISTSVLCQNNIDFYLNNCFVIGWNDSSVVYEKVDLLSNSECQNRTQLQPDRMDKFLCSDNDLNLNTSYDGQNGAPLICYNQGEPYLVGLSNKAIIAARPFKTNLFTKLIKYKHITLDAIFGY